jgi:hypothetical protein
MEMAGKYSDQVTKCLELLDLARKLIKKKCLEVSDLARKLIRKTF